MAKYQIRLNRWSEAEPYLQQCFIDDSTHVWTLQKLLKINEKKTSWIHVVNLSERLIRHDSDTARHEYALKMAKAYYELFQFENCQKTINQYIEYFDNEDLDEIKILERQITFARFAIEHPVPYNPKNLGEGINTKYSEYLPAITQDNRILVFTRYVDRSKSFPSLQEDFYFSEFEDDQWNKAIPLSRTINTEQNEGAPSISANGKVFYFAACQRKDSKGSCDIYYTYNRGNYWTTPKNLQSVNSEYWDSQPNISADGKMLYFVSNRPGGYGGKDIWAVHIEDGQVVGNPYNLGPDVNTDGDEMSPFMHFDLTSLYFSSNTNPGMGQQDIFLSRKCNDTTWTQPKNLGYPINSSENENSFFVASDAKTAYFSSRREDGFGEQDIYQLTLYQAIRPIARRIFSLINENAPESDTLYIAIRAEGRDSAVQVIAQEESIQIELNANQNYDLVAYAKNSLMQSMQLNLSYFDALPDATIRLHLPKAKVGDGFELAHILFDFDKADIQSTSYFELNQLVNYLKINRHLKILIEGHTDIKGSDAYNQVLSKKRAEAIKQFLIDSGIGANRLKTHGKGSTEIITQASQKQYINRRVVIQIVDVNNE